MNNHRSIGNRIVWLAIGALIFELTIFCGFVRAKEDLYLAQVPVEDSITDEDNGTPLLDVSNVNDASPKDILSEANGETEILQDSSPNEDEMPEKAIASADILVIKRWDVLTSFIVTLPAIISALTGLVAAIQIRKFTRNTEGEGSESQIQWQLLGAVGLFILAGVISSLFLLRWQRSTQSYVALTEEQMENMLLTTINELSESQVIAVNDAINQQLEPVKLDIASIKVQLQTSPSGNASSGYLGGGLNTPELDINRLSSEFFLLIRWGVIWVILAVFSLRILTVTLGALRTFLDTFLENYRRDRELNLRQRERRLIEQEQSRDRQ